MYPFCKSDRTLTQKFRSDVTLGTAVVHRAALLPAQLVLFFLWLSSKFAQTQEKCVLLYRSFAHAKKKKPKCSTRITVLSLLVSIKLCRTANMGRIRVVKRLIKYWLRAYMNLPHRIEHGRLPLICRRLKWKWGLKEQQLLQNVRIVYVIHLFLCQCVVPSLWDRWVALCGYVLRPLARAITFQHMRN